MAHTANPSTLDSVFLIKSDVKSWPKLDDERLLSQLHAKFWRKSMVEEEEEWRSNSGADDYGDDDDGVYDCDDDDYYDWEIGPGCYALDFGIENLERSKLWVRRDYLRIYKYCGTHYDKVKNFSGRVAPSVVITGHPGVGKSYWVYYAVRQRLSEGMPFIWYRSNRCFLFVEEGVFVKNLQDVDVSSFAPFLWAFVDADNSPSGVPPLFADSASKLFTIFVSFPRKGRWMPLENTTETVVVYMRPWTEDEIVQAAHVHGFTDTQLTSAKNMFVDYGPTPRICIDFVNNPDLLVGYKNLYDETSRDLSMDYFIAIGANELLDLDDASLTVCLISRDTLGPDSLVQASVGFTTPKVRGQV